VITVFSNPTLHTPPLPTRLQKNSLLLCPFWALSLLSVLLRPGRALLQDLKLRWKGCVRNRLLLRRGSPDPGIFPYRGTGAASDALLRFSCWLQADVDLGLRDHLARAPRRQEQACFMSPAHRATLNPTSTPARSSSSKGCFPSCTHLLRCQSGADKLQITLRTNNTPGTFFSVV